MTRFLDFGVFHADSCKPLSAAAAAGEIELHALARGAYPGMRLPQGEMRELENCWILGRRARSVFRAGLAPQWEIEFTFLSRGRIGFDVDDHQYELDAGDLTITRPWQSHRLGFPAVPRCRIHWIILDVGVRRPNQEWRWPEMATAFQGRDCRIDHASAVERAAGLAGQCENPRCLRGARRAGPTGQ